MSITSILDCATNAWQNASPSIHLMICLGAMALISTLLACMGNR